MTSSDTLLTALADARQRKQRADDDIRLLLAYARTLTQPRPYRLTDLARAAGMSISGVRTAYTNDDVTEACKRLGGCGGAERLSIPAATAALLSTSHGGTSAVIA
jgi:hypothetical protein